MGMLLKDLALESTWLMEGCALKLLVWLVRKARQSRSDKVRFSRREAADALGESEWSVRKAIEVLKENGVCRPDSTQPKRAITVKIIGSYVELQNESRPDSTQKRVKKKVTPPSSHPDSTQFATSASDNVSADSAVDEGGAPPSSHPNSTQFKEKETTKEKSPIPPIKKKTKKKNVLTDGSTDLPDGKPSLNMRAREVFETVYSDLYGSAYYWDGKDAGQMTQLLNKIKYSREKRAVPLSVDDESLLEALRLFLLSIDKEWISNNYSVAKIASNYNEIISELRRKQKNGEKAIGSGGSAVARRAAILSNVASLDEKWRRQNGAGAADR